MGGANQEDYLRVCVIRPFFPDIILDRGITQCGGGGGGWGGGDGRGWAT